MVISFAELIPCYVVLLCNFIFFLRILSSYKQLTACKHVFSHFSTFRTKAQIDKIYARVTNARFTRATRAFLATDSSSSDTGFVCC